MNSGSDCEPMTPNDLQGTMHQECHRSFSVPRHGLVYKDLPEKAQSR